MMFVDGENLAIRYAARLAGTEPQRHVVFEPNIYVWSTFANADRHSACEVVRRHYYTAVQGDDNKLVSVAEALKAVGIEAPRVFKKAKGRPSKRVDIQLSTEMLGHAHRGNYDLAILVAGDEDYVPLVEAVQREGKRVVLWFLSEGLSSALVRAADHAYDLAQILFKADTQIVR
jgi:uncharacterized LabA/DUF88 family protein